MPARIVLLVAMALTFLIYWPGLSGPFLFDDLPNLNPVQSWLTGELSWQSVVFGNQSGMLGRPLSMASFLLSAELSGHSPYAYKLGNLVIHLACGFCGWQVIRRLLAQDERLSANSDLFASIVVALWLLHPINVSTVLYSVQRMAQLSTLFVLASLWTYLVARRQLIEGKTRRALLGLFLLFPLLVLAGLMSKENAAVAPALCLVIELAYFVSRQRPNRATQAFFGLFLLLPGLAVVGLLIATPDRLLSGYAERDFTLVERLLTQSRVLMDYVGTVLVPRTPLLGLYTDDFQPSTGLLSPPTTLFSLLALLAISAGAVALRKRAPSVFAGWFFFLVAHGVESSILALELYFEHRNYLPAFGLILAVVGLTSLVPKDLHTNVFTPRQLGLVIAAGFALSFAFATGGRAHVWQAEDLLLEQGLKHHPESMRAQLVRATIALRTGETQASYDAFADLLASKNPRNRVIGRISWVTLDCMRGVDVPPADLQRALIEARPKLSMAEVPALRLLARVVKEQGCGKLTDSAIADGISVMLEKAAAQPEYSRSKWLTRFLAAEMFLHAGRTAEAQKQAELAWNASGDLPTGALLAQIYAARKMRPEAERLLAELDKRMGPYDTQGRAELAKTKLLLDQR
ncbi:tetratricopeptide repeat protein [Lysobacter sp. CA196]|uniref:tetratricopeptide repeat protein n=1 Tax=Lysobacter sp. CA196 TaxID=3455606 RepID=UPI003F8CF3FE